VLNQGCPQTLANSSVTLYDSVTVGINVYQNDMTARVNTTIPSIKAGMLVAAGNIDKTLNAALGCRLIAEDLFDAQNSICRGVLASLDSITLGLCVLAAVSAFSMWAYINASNVVGHKKVTILYSAGEEQKMHDERELLLVSGRLL
jgi:hypothetical protein